MEPRTVFLLSPAHCGGRRAATLFREAASFDLAMRLRSEGGAPLGEVFSYVSGLYFRGKLSYANRFGRPPPGIPPALVITAGRGLMDPRVPVSLADLEFFSTVPIDLREPRYTEPLAQDVTRLVSSMREPGQVVLLGSVATSKYVELLLSVLGDRLCFPEAFIGTGDMARGSILLRAAREEQELGYVQAGRAVRSLASARGRIPDTAG